MVLEPVNLEKMVGVDEKVELELVDFVMMASILVTLDKVMNMHEKVVVAGICARVVFHTHEREVFVLAADGLDDAAEINA